MTFVYNILPIDSLSKNKCHSSKDSKNKDNFNINKNGLTTISSKEKVKTNFLSTTLMEYIDSVCWEIFSSWVPKLLMDIHIQTGHHEDYNIFKHLNEDCLHIVYFDPQKCPVSNQFQVDVYFLAIKKSYHIVKNGVMLVVKPPTGIWNQWPNFHRQNDQLYEEKGNQSYDFIQ